MRPRSHQRIDLVKFIVRGVVFVIAALVTAASTTYAQPKEPLRGFVVDVRAASAGLPVLEGWTPVVPEGTQVPSRTLGLEAGAHVYFGRWRRATLGVGATWLIARATTTPPPLPEGMTTPPDATDPDVTTKWISLSPQLSLNFGHSLGWSYLSAGYGRTKVDSEATPAPGSTLRFTPVTSGWVSTLNYGGGARWFITDRVGVNFDVRFYRLSSFPAPATQLPGVGTSVLTAGAGISIK